MQLFRSAQVLAEGRRHDDRWGFEPDYYYQGLHYYQGLDDHGVCTDIDVNGHRGQHSLKGDRQRDYVLGQHGGWVALKRYLVNADAWHLHPQRHPELIHALVLQGNVRSIERHPLLR